MASDEALSEKLDDTEPQFKKTGNFDPYSDDPRLAVKKLYLCSITGIIIIGGTAGNVIVLNFVENNEKNFNVTTVNLVSDRDGFVWKGHNQLKLKIWNNQEHSYLQNGLQVASFLQILPPAAITCITAEASLNLLAAGTAHGLVVFDYKNDRCIIRKCTLNPNGEFDLFRNFFSYSTYLQLFRSVKSHIFLI